MEPDKKDILILRVLQKDSRLSLRKIAKKTGVSIVTVMKHIKRLEENGVITQYSAFLDYEKLGFDLQAITSISVAKGKLFDVEKKIASHPNVTAVYDVTGHFDVFVIARFKNRKSLDNYLKKVQTFDFVEKTETIIVLNAIKEGLLKL
ncbi:MAG: Lrp/AsnC family transcriptional regulator [Candidatus Diapherotrites archaeon]